MPDLLVLLLIVLAIAGFAAYVLWRIRRHQTQRREALEQTASLEATQPRVWEQVTVTDPETDEAQDDLLAQMLGVEEPQRRIDGPPH